jgi:hypothetical protein
MLEGRVGWLLRAAQNADDASLEYRKVAGNGRAPVVCFLPWLTPFRLAQRMGLVPRDFLVCYEMPPAIVSSEPELCVKALRRVVDDAENLFVKLDTRRSELLVIGLSLGNAPATYFANGVGARLCSIGSADRGDLLLWESPATRPIKDRAMSKGLDLADFACASRGYHPAENLAGLPHGCKFAMGKWDDCIPAPRRRALAAAVRKHARGSTIVSVDGGHAQTLTQGAFLLAENARHHDGVTGRS